MNPLREIHSRTVVLPAENVDTDQIIPARFLMTTSRVGLGEGLVVYGPKDQGLGSSLHVHYQPEFRGQWNPGLHR